MTTIFLAEYESRSFSFQAFGTTEKGALASLKRGLRLHAKQYDLPTNWFYAGYGMTSVEFDAEVNIIPMTEGFAYRDGSQIRSI